MNSPSQGSITSKVAEFLLIGLKSTTFSTNFALNNALLTRVLTIFPETNQVKLASGKVLLMKQVICKVSPTRCLVLNPETVGLSSGFTEKVQSKKMVKMNQKAQVRSSTIMLSLVKKHILLSSNRPSPIIKSPSTSKTSATLYSYIHFLSSLTHFRM